MDEIRNLLLRLLRSLVLNMFCDFLFLRFSLQLHFWAPELDARSLAVATGESSNGGLSIGLLIFSFVVFAQRSVRRRRALTGEVIAV
jgi:hypothetical protein